MADGFSDREVAEPVRVIGVGQQPARGLEAGQVVLHIEQVRAIGDGERTLVALLIEAGPDIVDELVEVPFGQVV